MEHDEQVVKVAPTISEINSIHDTVSFLQQIQCLFILVLFDEGHCTLIEFSKHNGNLIFRNSKLFVIMFIEQVIFCILRILSLISAVFTFHYVALWSFLIFHLNNISNLLEFKNIKRLIEN